MGYYIVKRLRSEISDTVKITLASLPGLGNLLIASSSEN